MKQGFDKQTPRARLPGSSPGVMTPPTPYTAVHPNAHVYYHPHPWGYPPVGGHPYPMAPSHFPSAPPPPIGYPVPQSYPFPQYPSASPTRLHREASQESPKKTVRLKPEHQEWLLQKMVESRFQFATASDSARVKFFEDLATEARQSRGLVLYGPDVRSRIHWNLCAERRILLEKGELPSRGPNDSRMIILQDEWNKMVLGVTEQTPPSYNDERELGRLEDLAMKNLLRHFDVLKTGHSDAAKRQDAEAAIAVLVATDVKSIIPFNIKTKLAASLRSNYFLSTSDTSEEGQIRKNQARDCLMEQGQGSRKRYLEEDEGDNDSESIKQKKPRASAVRSHLEGLVRDRAGAATDTAQWIQAHGSSQPITPASLGPESRQNIEASARVRVAAPSEEESRSAEQSEVAERLETVSIQDEGGEGGGIKKMGLHELAALKRLQNEDKKRKKADKDAKEKEKKKNKNKKKDKKAIRSKSD
ncbi:hypothetical protein M9X92_005141 [Pyricularia oryzae]|nr:hypothetical protein M9X92_005141 [Pyricularia oryzae]